MTRCRAAKHFPDGWIGRCLLPQFPEHDVHDWEENPAWCEPDRERHEREADREEQAERYAPGGDLYRPRRES